MAQALCSGTLKAETTSSYHEANQSRNQIMRQEKHIKLISLDPERHPNVVNKNYIDIVYMLSEEAPKAWCEIFNDIYKNDKTIRIDNDSSQYIVSWIRDMEDIPKIFNTMKDNISLTNTTYQKNLLAEEKLRKDSYNQDKSKESIRLDEILSRLDFE